MTVHPVGQVAIDDRQRTVLIDPADAGIVIASQSEAVDALADHALSTMECGMVEAALDMVRNSGDHLVILNSRAVIMQVTVQAISVINSRCMTNPVATARIVVNTHDLVQARKAVSIDTRLQGTDLGDLEIMVPVTGTERMVGADLIRPCSSISGHRWVHSRAVQARTEAFVVQGRSVRHLDTLTPMPMERLQKTK